MDIGIYGDRNRWSQELIGMNVITSEDYIPTISNVEVATALTPLSWQLQECQPNVSQVIKILQLTDWKYHEGGHLLTLFNLGGKILFTENVITHNKIGLWSFSLIYGGLWKSYQQYFFLLKFENFNLSDFDAKLENKYEDRTYICVKNFFCISKFVVGAIQKYFRGTGGLRGM